TFTEPPKHLDPARSYSADEYRLIAQIYEPPLQYHYLKRPYELQPLTADGIPRPRYLDNKGQRLSAEADPGRVARAVYEIKIKKGIRYENHPAFAAKEDGSPLYGSLTDAEIEGIDGVRGTSFSQTASRELLAEDYVLQIKRLADPLVESPVLPILEKYILGLSELAQRMRADLTAIRKERKERAGSAYNQSLDERIDPIAFDYEKYELPGAVVVDRYTYRIVLKRKYPQFIYWLAMPFFSPMPREVLDFYNQSGLREKNITLDQYPVGTGPFVMKSFNPNMEIILEANRNYHADTYPESGEEGDEEAGLLEDSGKRLPFIKRAVYKLEKEAIPRWNKFLQGYYDNSGISSESFDQAVTFGSAGRPEITPFIRDKGIRLQTSVMPSTYYTGFNMLDDVVGGYDESKQKLRQAISIAINYEEYLEIFNNGRGMPAFSPLPPGIFGHIEGEAGINPFVYTWDRSKEGPRRRSIEYARDLMREAGYPGGRGADGRPLVITFDNAWTGPGQADLIKWYIKKFKLLGIQLVNRTTDYNRFQEKMLGGNFQFFSWGWNADYPDPENFLFLLNGSNSKVKYKGENVANYMNAEFDRLFDTMENMDNSPARLAIIKKMLHIAQRDSPWVWGYHPLSFGLYHKWVKNIKPNAMANNTLKYLRVDAGLRAVERKAWNRPRVLPVAVFVLVLGGVILFGLISMKRKRQR
ncbi:MAG: ABC transporter substrate-binding protein, partial [Thermodesulfobacteriota bacterium]